MTPDRERDAALYNLLNQGIGITDAEAQLVQIETANPNHWQNLSDQSDPVADYNLGGLAQTLAELPQADQQDAIDQHAMARGYEPTDFRELVASQNIGISLHAMAQEMRAGTSWEDFQETARGRGAIGLLDQDKRTEARQAIRNIADADPEERQALLSQLDAAVDSGLIEQELTGTAAFALPEGLDPEFQMMTARTRIILSGEEDEEQIVSQKGEIGFDTSTEYLDTLFQDQAYVDLVNKWSPQANGAEGFVEERLEQMTERFLQQASAGEPPTQEQMQSMATQAIREVAMLKTTERWAGSAFLPVEMLRAQVDSQGRASFYPSGSEHHAPDSFIDKLKSALQPRVEVVGLTNVGGADSARIVTRMQGAPEWILDLADIPQAVTVGIMRATWDEDAAERFKAVAAAEGTTAAVGDLITQGVGQRANLFEEALKTDFAVESMDEMARAENNADFAVAFAKTSVPVLAGFATAVLFPDMFGALAGLGKAPAKLRLLRHTTAVDGAMADSGAHLIAGLQDIDDTGDAAEAAYQALDKANDVEITQIESVGEGIVRRQIDTAQSELLTIAREEGIFKPITQTQINEMPDEVLGPVKDSLIGMAPGTRRVKKPERISDPHKYGEQLRYLDRLSEDVLRKGGVDEIKEKKIRGLEGRRVSEAGLKDDALKAAKATNKEIDRSIKEVADWTITADKFKDFVDRARESVKIATQTRAAATLMTRQSMREAAGVEARLIAAAKSRMGSGATKLQVRLEDLKQIQEKVINARKIGNAAQFRPGGKRFPTDYSDAMQRTMDYARNVSPEARALVRRMIDVGAVSREDALAAAKLYDQRAIAFARKNNTTVARYWKDRITELFEKVDPEGSAVARATGRTIRRLPTQDIRKANPDALPNKARAVLTKVLEEMEDTGLSNVEVVVVGFIGELAKRVPLYAFRDIGTSKVWGRAQDAYTDPSLALAEYQESMEAVRAVATPRGQAALKQTIDQVEAAKSKKALGEKAQEVPDATLTGETSVDAEGKVADAVIEAQRRAAEAAAKTPETPETPETQIETSALDPLAVPDVSEAKKPAKIGEIFRDWATRLDDTYPEGDDNRIGPRQIQKYERLIRGAKKTEQKTAIEVAQEQLNEIVGKIINEAKVVDDAPVTTTPTTPTQATTAPTPTPKPKAAAPAPTPTPAASIDPNRDPLDVPDVSDATRSTDVTLALRDWFKAWNGTYPRGHRNHIPIKEQRPLTAKVSAKGKDVATAQKLLTEIVEEIRNLSGHRAQFEIGLKRTEQAEEIADIANAGPAKSGMLADLIAAVESKKLKGSSKKSKNPILNKDVAADLAKNATNPLIKAVMGAIKDKVEGRFFVRLADVYAKQDRADKFIGTGKVAEIPVQLRNFVKTGGDLEELEPATIKTVAELLKDSDLKKEWEALAASGETEVRLDLIIAARSAAVNNPKLKEIDTLLEAFQRDVLNTRFPQIVSVAGHHRATDSILVSQGHLNESIVAHEILHAATHRALRSGKHEDVVNDLRSLQTTIKTSLEATAAKGKLSDKLINFQKALEGQSPSQVDELIAYAFTDAEVQAFLKTVDVPSKMDSSLIGAAINAFEAVVGSIRKLVGLKDTAETTTALEAIIGLTGKIILDDGSTVADAAKARVEPSMFDILDATRLEGTAATDAELDALAIDLGQHLAANLEHVLDLHVTAKGWDEDAKIGLLQRIVDARQQQEGGLLKAYQVAHVEHSDALVKGVEDKSGDYAWDKMPGLLAKIEEAGKAYDQHLQESSAIRKLLGRVTRSKQLRAPDGILGATTLNLMPGRSPELQSVLRYIKLSGEDYSSIFHILNTHLTESFLSPEDLSTLVSETLLSVMDVPADVTKAKLSSKLSKRYVEMIEALDDPDLVTQLMSEVMSEFVRREKENMQKVFASLPRWDKHLDTVLAWFKGEAPEDAVEFSAYERPSYDALDISREELIKLLSQPNAQNNIVVSDLRLKDAPDSWKTGYSRGVLRDIDDRGKQTALDSGLGLSDLHGKLVEALNKNALIGPGKSDQARQINEDVVRELVPLINSYVDRVKPLATKEKELKDFLSNLSPEGSSDRAFHTHHPDYLFNLYQARRHGLGTKVGFSLMYGDVGNLFRVGRYDADFVDSLPLSRPTDALKQTVKKADGTEKEIAEVEFGEDGRALITVLNRAGSADGADISTVVHELGHVLRRDLTGTQKDSLLEWFKKSADYADLKIENGRFVGDKDIVDQAEELFAGAFQKHLTEAATDTPVIQRVFRNMQKDLQRLLRGSDAEDVEELRPIFENLIGGRDYWTDPDPTVGRFFNDLVQRAKSMFDKKPRITENSAAGYVFREANQAELDVVRVDKDGNQTPLINPEGVSDAWEAGDNIGFVKDGKLVKPPLSLEADEMKLDAASGREITRQLLDNLAVQARKKKPVAVTSKEQASVGEDIVQQMRVSIAGNSVPRKIAKAVLATFVGGDPHQALGLTLLPETTRDAVLAGTRLIEHAYGEITRLITDNEWDVAYKFLSGEVVDFTSIGRGGRVDGVGGGRQAMASGYNSMEVSSRALSDWLKTKGDKATEALEELSNRLKKNEFASIDDKTLSALKRLFGDEKAPDFFKRMVKALKEGKTMNVDGYRVLNEILTRMASDTVVPAKDTKAWSKIAEDMFTAIENSSKAIGPTSKTRLAVILTGYGNLQRAVGTWSGMGLMQSTEHIKGFTKYLDGEMLTPDEMVKAEEMSHLFGMNTDFVEGKGLFADAEGYMLPEAAMRKVEEALKRGDISAGKWAVGSTASELPGYAGVFVRTMKKRMTRGAYVLRQRYFLMNTVDHFLQLAGTPGVGFRTAAASTARMMLQNIMVLPGAGFASLLNKNPEAIRSSLQKHGDKVAQFLSQSKWRIDVNDVLKGTEGDIVIAGNVYSYQDIRQLAIEEGIFSSFDTSELAAEIGNQLNEYRRASENAGLPRQAVQQIHDAHNAMSRNLDDIAEAWGERERLGAMITLMEKGIPPRRAARLTIDALYDYAGSMSRGDRHFLVSLFIPFWAFQKNANQQFIRRALSPEGAYKMGVLRRGMEYGAGAVETMWFGATYDPYGVDVRSMAENERNKYMYLRKVIEYGYGPIHSDSMPPSMQKTLLGILGVQSLEELDERIATDEDLADKLYQLENGYGGIANVPKSVIRGIRMALTRPGAQPGMFAGFEEGEAYEARSAELGSLLSGMEMVDEEGNRQNLSQFVGPIVDPAGRAGFRRHRVGIAVPPKMTESLRAYLKVYGTLNEGEIPYSEIMIPEPAIYAGLKHVVYLTTAYASSMSALIGAAPFVGDEDDVSLPLPTTLAYSFSEVVDVTRAPIPGLMLSSIGASSEEGIPRRISPLLMPAMKKAFPQVDFIETRQLADYHQASSPEAQAQIIQDLADSLNIGPDEAKKILTAKETRYYTPPGALSFAVENFPMFGEVNRRMLDMPQVLDAVGVIDAPGARDPLEVAMGNAGRILEITRFATGVETAQVSRHQQARREDVRFDTSTVEPPADY